MSLKGKSWRDKKGSECMHIFGTIKSYKHTDDGTELLLFVPEKKLGHKIKRYRDGGTAEADVILSDDRYITTRQRKFIYALLGDISEHTGYDPEQAKGLFKYLFMAKTGLDYFSLSARAVEHKCSVTTARLFIDYLITLCFENDIPFLGKISERTDDIDRILFLCIVHRRCSVTGEKGAEIHHCTGSKIGMGSNRRKVSHSGRHLIALRSDKHREIETIGDRTFFEKHHVYGIQVDDETLKDLGYKVDEIEDHERGEKT